MTILAGQLAVAHRFEAFLENISLTPAQVTDGKTKRENVCWTLNSQYYGSASGTNHSRYVGSWGKGTRIRPPRDVDVLFELPSETYHRFERRTGNKQSQLLQEVKSVLGASFPRTDIRGDGPVVKVPFQSFNVELVPAFKLDTGRYWIPITTDGGWFKLFDPDAEVAHLQRSSAATNGNTRNLARMLKCWQANCLVPLKSFYLELLSENFLGQWSYADKTKVYYDWMTRDFFAYLIRQTYGTLTVPGTGETLYLGDAWKSRAQNAHERAAKACQFEADGKVIRAGEEWQKIFGSDIPVS